jgi:dynein heavy chain
LIFQNHYVRRLVEFTEMPTSSWNESHDVKLKEFLLRSEKRQLFFFVDPMADPASGQYKLIAQNELPATQCDELFYFVKSHVSAEITSKETFHKYVQYGAFNGKHLLSLLRICSGLYAPLFFDNNTWPDSTFIHFIVKNNLIYSDGNLTFFNDFTIFNVNLTAKIVNFFNLRFLGTF